MQSRMKHLKCDLKSLFRACWNPKLLQPYANISFKGLDNYLKEENSHEAGYDSFMTGCGFIGMINYLYEVKQQPFVFANAHHYNKILYSRFAGEISLVGPVFSQRGDQYRRRVVVYPALPHQHPSEQVGQLLSKLGTVAAHENHG